MAIVTTDFDGITRPQGAAYDIGAYEFTGTPPPPSPSVLVQAPNGGERWAIGSSQLIGWHSTNAVGNVDILLSRDSGKTFSLLATNLPSTDNADNVFIWVVTGPRSTRCRVLIKSHLGTATDTSNANFRING